MTLPPRTLLFTPGTRPDRFTKAMTTSADAVIFDLEDSVAPDQKDFAREQVSHFIRSQEASQKQIVIRVNPFRTLTGLKDLLEFALITPAPEFLLLPKAEHPEDISAIGEILDAAGTTCNIAALIESARGVERAADIARASSRLGFLMFGAADYAADIGQAVATFQPDYARASLVNAATAAGIVAVDSPFFDIYGKLTLDNDCLAGRALGFYGKAAIHPSQLEIIELRFAPTAGELAHARRILDAPSNGVAVIDGKMIDEAILRWARRITRLT